MVEWFYQVQLWVALAAGLFTLVLGLFRKLPSLWSVGSLALVELGLLIQLVNTIILTLGGERAKVDTVEFYAYLVVAAMVPIGTVFWALVERTWVSTLILGVGAFTVAVMLVRMNQIWTGSY